MTDCEGIRFHVGESGSGRKGHFLVAQMLPCLSTGGCGWMWRALKARWELEFSFQSIRFCPRTQAGEIQEGKNRDRPHHGPGIQWWTSPWSLACLPSDRTLRLSFLCPIVTTCLCAAGEICFSLYQTTRTPGSDSIDCVMEQFPFTHWTLTVFRVVHRVFPV